MYFLFYSSFTKISKILISSGRNNQSDWISRFALCMAFKTWRELLLTDILAVQSRVTRQAVTLDLTGSADFTAFLVPVARTEIARAQITDGSVVGISVVTACTGFAGASYVASWTTASFDLGRSSISGEVLHGCVHADVTDVCRGHSLAVGRADQNSFQIGEHNHKVRPGSATWSFGRQTSPFVFF